MMYVSFDFYQQEYGGTMPEIEFVRAEHRAEAFLRSVTYLQGDVFDKPNSLIQFAVCAAADVYYASLAAQERQAEQGRSGTVRSENIDGYSVTYATDQADGESAEFALRRKAYDAVNPYLRAAGWIQRKVRCGNAHECGHHGL